MENGSSSAREIVPGDIIQVGLGDLVPADAKIVAGEVSVDQSALTGESLPMTTHQSGILYSSSIIKRGQAKALVLNTGASTYFGKTAEFSENRQTEITPRTDHVRHRQIRNVHWYRRPRRLWNRDVALTRALDVLTIVRFALIFLMGPDPPPPQQSLLIVLAVGAIGTRQRRRSSNQTQFH